MTPRAIAARVATAVAGGGIMLTEQKLSELRALEVSIPGDALCSAGLDSLVKIDLGTLCAVVDGYVKPAPGPDGLALTVLADIREALGVGMKPMLSELPGIVRARLEGLETELAEANTKANADFVRGNQLRALLDTAREYIRALEEDKKESSLAMKVANERIQELEDVAKAAHGYCRCYKARPFKLTRALMRAGYDTRAPLRRKGGAS